MTSAQKPLTLVRGFTFPKSFRSDEPKIYHCLVLYVPGAVQRALHALLGLVLTTTHLKDDITSAPGLGTGWLVSSGARRQTQFYPVPCSPTFNVLMITRGDL